GTLTGVRSITKTRIAAPVVVIASSIVAFVAAGVAGTSATVAFVAAGVAGTSAAVAFVTAGVAITASGVVRPVSAGGSTGIVVAGTLTGVRSITKTRIAAPVTVIASTTGAAISVVIVIVIVVTLKAQDLAHSKAHQKVKILFCLLGCHQIPVTYIRIFTNNDLRGNKRFYILESICHITWSYQPRNRHVK
ncbi:MAG: hypothetical protein ACP5CD_04305, partial [Thermovirgaceae bacterium]